MKKIISKDKLYKIEEEYIIYSDLEDEEKIVDILKKKHGCDISFIRKEDNITVIYLCNEIFEINYKEIKEEENNNE